MKMRREDEREGRGRREGGKRGEEGRERRKRRSEGRDEEERISSTVRGRAERGTSRENVRRRRS